MKTALVTGSTSGIGKQIGTDLLYNNYNVIFNGKDEWKFEEIYRENAWCCSRFKFWKADLSKFIYLSTVSKLKIKKLDVLVLNIGITDRTSFDKITISNWHNVIHTNLTMPFFLVQQLKDKIANNGRIIFISSILADYPHSRSISYAVSKAGINCLVKNLVKEFAPKNITVNAVAPGFIDTKWHDSKNKAQLERIKRRIAKKRFGTTKEVSSLVKEIIRNPYINGQILTIDGGYDYE